MKRLILLLGFLLAASIAWGQCGTLVINPTTPFILDSNGKRVPHLDCIGTGGGGSGTVTTVSVTTANGVSGSVANATTTPAITIVLGAITPTTVNKVTITAPATAATITISDNKTLAVSNSLTLAGADSTVMTFPTTSATIARTDAAQTFTGVQTFSTPIALGSLASTVVNASSPGAGIAHFAGSTQTVTSSAIVNADITNATIDVTTKITGIVPVSNGGTGVANPTASAIYKGAGSSAMTASSITDNGTTVATTEAVTALSVATGTSPPAVTIGTGGVPWACGEGTVPSAGAAAGVDLMYCDSVQHGPMMSRNNGPFLPLPQNAATTTVGDPACQNSNNGGLLTDCGITSQLFLVASNFTTSGSGTALEAITGLTWTFPASTAMNLPFECHIVYHQNVATAAVAFGFQDATVAPTNLAAKGTMSTNTTAFTQANVVASATTTATAIVSATPSAITTNWIADLTGYVEQPSNASTSVFTIRVSTATAADTVTVLRGSFCRTGF